MAQCAKCGKKGLFLRVNKEGLCKSCAEKSTYEINIEKYTENKRKPSKIFKELEAIAPKLNLIGDEILQIDEEYRVFALHNIKTDPALKRLYNYETKKHFDISKTIRLRCRTLFNYDDISGIKVYYQGKELFCFGNPADISDTYILKPERAITDDKFRIFVTIRSYINGTYLIDARNEKDWNNYLGMLCLMAGEECPPMPMIDFPFFTDEMKEVVYNEITSLNAQIEQAAKHGSPKVKIKKFDINPFKIRVTHKPLTPTGKTPKFPKSLFWTTVIGDTFKKPKKSEISSFYKPIMKDNIWGTLFYKPDGTVGRAEITIWKNNHCYTLKCTEQNNELALSAIDTFNADGTKRKVYRK